ncbi:hypothetical protein TNCT_212531 [Trichonephila clavata]|uniref:Uncharacterized protein n=1 Tax=Trichonephila clavata TaxID=2740835 RepID=A0A8X6HZI6_TRICU|nr:hypothetical protein TNCT_212531 [Trichonephila clavata]
MIRQTQELLDRDKPQRLSFEVSFLNRMTVDLHCLGMAMWSDKDHLYLNRTANTESCRISAKKNPRIRTEFPV